MEHIDHSGLCLMKAHSNLGVGKAIVFCYSTTGSMMSMVAGFRLYVTGSELLRVELASKFGLYLDFRYQVTSSHPDLELTASGMTGSSTNMLQAAQGRKSNKYTLEADEVTSMHSAGSVWAKMHWDKITDSHNFTGIQ